MSIADARQSRITAQGLRHEEIKPHGSMQPAVRHRDPSPVMAVLVVIVFVAMSIGVVVCSTYLDHAAKNKVHEAAHNRPIVDMKV